jgi:hypothetical protein
VQSCPSTEDTKFAARIRGVSGRHPQHDLDMVLHLIDANVSGLTPSWGCSAPLIHFAPSGRMTFALPG